MTQDSRAQFETWKLTESLPCPPHKDPIEWACFNAFNGGRASLLNELQSDEMVEVVARAISIEIEEDNTPYYWADYEQHAKAAITAITTKFKGN